MSLLSARDLLNEPNYIYSMLDEYYKTIDKYKHQFTTSVPIRYFSINLEKSIIDEKLDAIYEITEKHLNGLVFDVYELAPTFYSSPITLEISMNEELTGLDIQKQPISITFVGVFNTNQIHLNDLAQFYTEYWNKQIFQVYNIRTPLITNFRVPVFELDLTTTPIPYDKALDKIRVNNIYVYDYTTRKFITYEQFKNKDKILKSMENDILPNFNNQYFDTTLELYYYSENSENYFTKEINEIYYQLIDYLNKDFLHISNLFSPAGLLNYFDKINEHQYISNDKKIHTPKQLTIYKLDNPLLYKLSKVKTITLDDNTRQQIDTKIDETINDPDIINIDSYPKLIELINKHFKDIISNDPINDKKLLMHLIISLTIANLLLKYMYK